MAGHVKAVMSRFGFACCGVAVGASSVKAMRGLLRSGQAVTARKPSTIRKEAKCQHLQTSIHIGADSISKFPRK